MKEREIVASDLQKSGYTQRLILVSDILKGDHQYVTLRLQEVVLRATSPFTEKTLIAKEKIGQINTMKTNCKRRKDLRLVTWNVRSLYRPGGLRITFNVVRKYKIAIATIQETRWDKLTPQTSTSNGYNIYTSSFAKNHEFGTGFLVD
jgi:hypothetical protein